MDIPPADKAGTTVAAAYSDGDPVARGIGTSISGAQTKGRYEASEQDSTGHEWGIVHLYRDVHETQGLVKESQDLGPDLWSAGHGVTKLVGIKPNPPPKDEDCTTLCILAVPSYLTPADLLAFVGEETREQVNHFRMIRTSRSNRYMVLMKFKNGKGARAWQHEWNGRVFNSMEPETCHVVFLKSVEIIPPRLQSSKDSLDSPMDGSRTFPRIGNDPFVGSAHTSKPLAPRTPSLVELPTCPVCLERMDETTGLLTILCQHVFHCTCLEKWSGGGCPVCRYTHDDFSTRVGSFKFKSKTQVAEYEVSDDPLECEACHADANLWQCLICGKVGCGRYEGKHAYQHFEESGHNFSMDLDSKRVWDYAADVYVHRIIQDAAKPGEKLVELPGRRRETTALDVDEDVELAKMEDVALEYTHLLTSQLDSQRVYFEDIVQRTADKASEASKRAESAISEYEFLRAQLQKLNIEYHGLVDVKLPTLETEKQRIEKRAIKLEDLAKASNQKYLEEKSLASSLMARIKHMEEHKMATMQRRIQELEEDNATKDLLMEGLREEHRDAMVQISAQKKLREMVARGELDEEDLEGATIEAGPAAKKPGRKRSKAAAAKTKSGSEKSAVASPAQRPQSEECIKSTDVDVLGHLLQEKLGLGLNTCIRTGIKWDDENVGKIIEDFKQNLMTQGVLTNMSTTAAATGDSVNGQEDADVSVDKDIDASSAVTASAVAPTKKKKRDRKR